MTTFFLFFLCFFSSAQSFVVPHRVWLANTSQSNEFSHFVLHWIEKTNLAPVASAPLVVDADLDGSLDLFFATADGSLHGILQFMKCSVHDKRCNKIQHNWPVVLHGESFVSSPVAVRVDYAPVIIMFISHRGGLWGFDCWGNIKIRFQLPDMWLDAEVTRGSLPVTNRRTLTEHLRWAPTDRTADMDVKGIHRLQPAIYATPLAPVGTAHRKNLNTKESDVLILAVNFISRPDIRSIEEGIVVSGLVGISRRMLTADGISPTESLRRERAIHWVPLELDWLNASQPPYLFASPVVVADLPSFDHMTGKHRDQTHVTFSVLVPSFSGRLHRIPLPLANDELDSVRGFSWTAAQSPFTHECIPLDCQPTQTEVVGRAYSPSQAGLAKLCCLLLDASSRLRLLDVSRAEPPPSAGNGLPQDLFKQSVVWDYKPAVYSNETWEQVGQVSLAPGCQFVFQSNCSLWAVYPTPDGFVHAVDIPTGTIPLGYPVKLFDVIQMSVGGPSLGFSHGSGQLYVGSDSMFWMVFADTRGWLYHLRLFSPMVKISSVCPDGSLSCFQHESTQNPSETWHSPPFFVLNSPDMDCAGSKRIGLLQLGSKGVSFLTSDLSDCYLSSPKKRRLLDIRPPAHQLLQSSLFDASFTGTDGKPASRLAFSAEPSALSFRIQHCPRSAKSLSGPFEDEGNLSLQSPYLVKLLNPLGIPISDWSPTTLLPASKSFLANLTDCHGNAHLTHPLGGLYSGQVHLLIVNAATGRILAGPPSLAPHSDIGASANLLLNSLWLQVVPLMVYLPGVYLFVGLAFVHGLAVSDPVLFSLPFISTYRRVKRPAQTA